MTMQCLAPLCPNPAAEHSRYCLKHKPTPKVKQKDRASYQAPKGWKQFSARYRVKNPYCQCGRPTEVTGHVVTHETLVGLFGEDYLRVLIREGVVEQYFQPQCYSCNTAQSWTDSRHKKP